MAQKKIQQDQTDGLVKGPASSTDNALVRFDGTAGKLIQDSTQANISDTGVLTLGPTPTENPYPSARLRVVDETGALSDMLFTAYGGGYGTLVLAGMTGTSAAPGDTGATATTGIIEFRKRVTGAYTSPVSLTATADGKLNIYGSFGTAGLTINGIPIAATTNVQTFTNKTLTAPSLTTLSPVKGTSNGGSVFEVVDNSASTNYLRFTSEATGSPPSVGAQGVDTNVHLYLLGKGSGQVYIDDGSANVPAVGTTSTQTLTNKRITPRLMNNVVTGQLTPAGDTTDFAYSSVTAAFTILAPSGTPTNGQKLLVRLKDNGTAYSLTWNAIYRAIGVTLPTTTVISKTLYVGMVYNSTDTKWDVIAVAQEA